MIMAGIRFSKLKSVVGSINSCSRLLPSKFNSVGLNSVKGGGKFHVRATFGLLGHNYHNHNSCKRSNFESRACAQWSRPSGGLAFSAPTLSNGRFLSSYPSVGMTPVLDRMSYWSFSSGEADGKGEISVGSGVGESDVSGGDRKGYIGFHEGLDKLRDTWQSVVDAATPTLQKVKETSDQLIPQAQHVLDSHPYLEDVAVPVGGTVIAAVLAWVVLPRFLKKLHSYSLKGSAVLLPGTISAVNVPYEKSVWAALVDPVRYLMTFMAFSEICYLVAPHHVASQFIAQAWKGAVILSFVWFLQRWKTNFVAHTLANKSTQVIDRDTLLTLDKVSTVGLLGVGVIALAEACGVAVQSLLTVGGIGGVATAFAAKDILGNVLSGLSMQFSKPFSLGDYIKAGSVEGQVVEMGLTTTSLLNFDKFPVIVPNSTFSSQVIVNISRAQWRAFIRRIPLKFDNLENIPQVSDEIKLMINSNPKVFLDQEAPYCYLSKIESSYAELTIGCNLKRLSRVERYSIEQDITLQSIQIIKQHGLSLGSEQQI